MIDEFRGKYRWLSNFEGGVEAKYQAAKTLDEGWKRRILDASSPGEAKRLGRKAPIRKDWEVIKIGVMYSLLLEKFKEEPYRSLLLATGEEELIEGNWWGDTFWGVCRGKGRNVLGTLLMRVREELRR